MISVWIPLTLWCAGLVVVVVGAAQTWVAVGRCVFIVTMVSSIGQTGHVGVVEVDVGGFGRLAVGVVVAVVMVVVVVMVVGVGHCVGSRQASHRLLHMGVVRWRLHLQRSLSCVGLMPVGSSMATVHEMITEESTVTLWRNTQSKTTRASTSYEAAESMLLMLSL